MAGSASSEIDETLRSWVLENPTVVGYVVMNSDGIPIKIHKRMQHEKAVQYAALISDFLLTARRTLRELLPDNNDLASVRIRTKEGTEILVVTAAEYVLIVVQNCTGTPLDWETEAENQGEGGGA
uniref:Roadblock/LAMTOR2 domain-containing protein n=1 Tax=Chromera velia CCMP2878 TaxID=1169474 RepID=A0A0G4HIY7_9ALVE|mmetsp:Transcript_11009/g.21271  ORF Transcript_11009/g.21271 Transcript_11009/m.21271 type:complete len:125 (-) Transcript_11009:211-585(-)|eukprot:Cvel_7030.t1-p1 / transcript=Cvel_7030.t1 / gene=Cvel_7030 / organism=Chromera_velia_CCMP2878 / gene_product=Dynein light chain roadblock-type 1, putative / transcript_product=Dynein light chain roadblock-type 1, putative / location=Cvel_scaffold358:82105-84480(-) / protein_length=124 / sequence_SO=supercontig / SO=protein_coding / is_pseudo=false